MAYRPNPPRGSKTTAYRALMATVRTFRDRLRWIATELERTDLAEDHRQRLLDRELTYSSRLMRAVHEAEALVEARRLRRRH